MLAEYSDEEIEIVLAHELAHHVHGDIWKGLLFESASCWSSGFSRRPARSGPQSAGWRSRDRRMSPACRFCCSPPARCRWSWFRSANALSRAYERSADRFALEITRNPAAFISAMKRLGAQNLAEEHPSKMAEWLFYSHPPIRERIAAAQAFKT